VSSIEVDSPILCSSFPEPGEHRRIEDGRMPERRQGRRPAGYWYRDPRVPEPEAGFTRGVWVRALPGCTSQGETREEALAMIREAIEVCVESLEAHGDPIPGPIEIERISISV
jgi:predicted RNase H-like HicB family nuclease